MATTTARLPHRLRFSDWFVEFLRQELAPYPGRGMVVARMVIAATLTMILIVTFRIPGGAVGALCAFILSRENLASTAKSGVSLVLAFVLGALFIPIGARMFASIPLTHFLWEAISLFGIFFILRTLSNFALATALSLVATNALATWYLTGPAERNVELTLWQVLATAVGAAVTISVEAVFLALSKHDELRDGIDSRLTAIEAMLRRYAAGEPVDAQTDRQLTQYAMVGMGAMRRYIARANYDPLQRMQMSTLVALTSRSVDFAAGLRSMVPAFAAPLQQRAAALAERIGEIRRSLRTHAVPPAWEPAERSAGTPLFSELEAMVGLMPKVFSSATSIDPRFEILEAPPAPNRFFVEDAFTNPDHLRYVLGGTLAAMLCYVLYVSLDWPGISTAVTTCVLTGLSNIGASRQKQVLRIAGVVLGGFVFGLGAQVFVLPYIDSITGFAVLFATVTAIAAWVSTSSARLSYAGLQIAFAFFLINLTEFRIQLSLTVARNRVVGVLLGITMMWLVFERLYSKPAFDEMVRLFVSNVRLMATLVSESRIGADAETILQIRRHRDHVYRKFGEVSAQADAVPFETGPARAGHMAARDRIRNWQSTLRTFYLMEVPLVQFRLYRNPEDMSPAFRNIERRFLQDCAATLNLIADTIEEQLDGKALRPAPGKSLQTMLDAAEAAESGALLPEEQGLLRLTRSLAALLDGLEADATTEPLLATG